MQVECRRRTEDDDDFILETADASFHPWAHNPARTVRNMLDSRRSIVEVAVSPKLRLGFFVVEIHPVGHAFGPFASPSVAYLTAIAVAPDRLGRGIGRILLQRAGVVAAARGAIALGLMTASDNRRARALFESEGFQTLLVEPDSYSARIDALRMTKPLPPLSIAFGVQRT